MFDDVGRGRRVRTQREAGSVLLSLAINGTFVGALAFASFEVAEEVLEDDGPVEVSFFEEAPPEEPEEEVAPPPPPPPPPPPSTPEPEEEEEEDAEEVDVEEVEEEVELEDVKDLRQDLDDATKYKHEDAGIEGGVEGGVAGGVLGGSLGGVPGGELGGHSEVRAVHWSEVKPKRRIAPKMPDAAKQLNMSEERCNVRFFINEKGVPYDVRLETCPAVFHESALEAAWKWRFYPMKVEGKAVKTQFTLAILYRLTG